MKIQPKYQIGQTIAFNRDAFGAYYKDRGVVVGTIHTVEVQHGYMENPDKLETKIRYWTNRDDDVPEESILGLAETIPAPPSDIEVLFAEDRRVYA